MTRSKYRDAALIVLSTALLIILCNVLIMVLEPLTGNQTGMVLFLCIIVIIIMSVTVFLAYLRR
ncbi:MAG: hypothetical protein M0P20_08575 [Methanocorpusculum sp.]|jgi:hypothetical protein|nr:hypothetical protein [Methanocorpusculum sp.]